MWDKLFIYYVIGEKIFWHTMWFVHLSELEEERLCNGERWRVSFNFKALKPPAKRAAKGCGCGVWELGESVGI